MVTFFSFLHPVNAFFPIVSTFLPMVASVMEVLFLKADASMEVTL